MQPVLVSVKCMYCTVSGEDGGGVPCCVLYTTTRIAGPGS